MSDSLISVIVPVYNSEQTLNRCIDSILGQTYRNFELLLINDGSMDRSGEICDEYAQQDSRVKVFHKENGGVSSTRNVGLDNARGEWITFCDSDDTVTAEWLQNAASICSGKELIRKELARVRATAMGGSFGTQKEHYDLRRVKVRTKQTEILYIFFGIHTANVVHLAVA